MPNVKIVFILLFAYLLGSISFGYIVAKRWASIDIRQYGSGNIGMTNIWRVMGWQAGMLVFIGDAGKGVLAAWLGKYFGGDTLAVMAGFAVMAGHTYPLFLNFKGGKAVATGVGVLGALSIKVTLFALALWLVTVGVTKYVSLASILAAVSVPMLLFALDNPLPHLLFGIIGAAFVIYKHIPNIKRLRDGTEYKIGQKVKK